MPLNRPMGMCNGYHVSLATSWLVPLDGSASHAPTFLGVRHAFLSHIIRKSTGADYRRIAEPKNIAEVKVLTMGGRCYQKHNHVKYRRQNANGLGINYEMVQMVKK